MSSRYGTRNVYGHSPQGGANKKLSQHKQKLESELELHQHLSAALQELTGFQQLKAFRMALKMTSAQELTEQAQHTALQECLTHTQLGQRLREGT